MPLRKFTSVEEMPPVAALTPLDPENIQVACELTELAFGMHPWRLQPGVRKFRSVAEAHAVRGERQKTAPGAANPPDPS